MDALGPSQLQFSKLEHNNPPDSKKVDQLDWVLPAGRRQFASRLFPLLLLLSIYAVSQSSQSSATPKLIRGSVLGLQGQPIPNASVEIRDLMGRRIGGGYTNSAGGFEISSTAEPGEYIVVAAKDPQRKVEPITVGLRDIEIKISFPNAVQMVAANPAEYTISSARLRVPAKASKHLKSAQKRFEKKDVAGAITEIEQALKIDVNCAPAFCMRSFVRLAANDFNGAREDAVRAVALDSWDADSYVALAMAYNGTRQFQQAAEAARHALNLHPDSWQGQLELAKSFYGLDQYVLAISVLDRLEKDFPDVHLLRADVLMCLGRVREAAEQFAVFLNEAPKDSRGPQIRQIVASARQAAIDSNPLQR